VDIYRNGRAKRIGTFCGRQEAIDAHREARNGRILISIPRLTRWTGQPFRSRHKSIQTQAVRTPTEKGRCKSRPASQRLSTAGLQPEKHRLLSRVL
jgi:hypothetical protein